MPSSTTSNTTSNYKIIWRKAARALVATKSMVVGALAVILASVSVLPLPTAQAIELGTSAGYGVLGHDGFAPYMKANVSFGKRFVVDFNGGVIFANKDIGFSNFGKIVPVEDEIKDVRKTSCNVLYTIGMDFRIFVRKENTRHNAYLGAGVDWLPQLATYYPGVKLLTGYQLALLKKRDLILRFGAEYYLYGVVPVNTLSFTTSISYRI